jgi:hypothetical protein
VLDDASGMSPRRSICDRDAAELPRITPSRFRRRPVPGFRGRNESCARPSPTPFGPCSSVRPRPRNSDERSRVAPSSLLSVSASVVQRSDGAQAIEVVSGCPKARKAQAVALRCGPIDQIIDAF